MFNREILKSKYYLFYFIRDMLSVTDMGMKKTEEQLQAIYSVKQTLKMEMTQRLKLESTFAEEKVIIYIRSVLYRFC